MGTVNAFEGLDSYVWLQLWSERIDMLQFAEIVRRVERAVSSEAAIDKDIAMSHNIPRHERDEATFNAVRYPPVALRDKIIPTFFGGRSQSNLHSII